MRDLDALELGSHSGRPTFGLGRNKVLDSQEVQKFKGTNVSKTSLRGMAPIIPRECFRSSEAESAVRASIAPRGAKCVTEVLSQPRAIEAQMAAGDTTVGSTPSGTGSLDGLFPLHFREARREVKEKPAESSPGANGVRHQAYQKLWFLRFFLQMAPGYTLVGSTPCSSTAEDSKEADARGHV